MACPLLFDDVERGIVEENSGEFAARNTEAFSIREVGRESFDRDIAIGSGEYVFENFDKERLRENTEDWAEPDLIQNSSQENGDRCPKKA